MRHFHDDKIKDAGNKNFAYQNQQHVVNEQGGKIGDNHYDERYDHKRNNISYEIHKT